MNIKDIIKIILTTLLTTATVRAATGLEGFYKFKNFECSSGIAAKALLASEGSYEATFEMSALFTNTQLTSSLKLNTKLSALKGQEYIKEYQEAIVQANQLTDSHQKQQSLDEINNEIEAVKKLMAGSTCFSSSIMNYTVYGNKINTIPVSYSGTCPDVKVAASETEFSLSGNVLKVASQVSDGTCPTGDTAFTVFERVD